MKLFDSIGFSHAAAMAELGDFKGLLDIINSNKATCLTLDDLYAQLHDKLTRLQKLATGG